MINFVLLTNEAISIRVGSFLILGSVLVTIGPDRAFVLRGSKYGVHNRVRFWAWPCYEYAQCLQFLACIRSLENVWWTFRAVFLSRETGTLFGISRVGEVQCIIFIFLPLVHGHFQGVCRYVARPSKFHHFFTFIPVVIETAFRAFHLLPVLGDAFPRLVDLDMWSFCPYHT